MYKVRWGFEPSASAEMVAIFVLKPSWYQAKSLCVIRNASHLPGVARDLRAHSNVYVLQNTNLKGKAIFKRAQEAPLTSDEQS